jgi:transcriptional repressor NrdR
MKRPISLPQAEAIVDEISQIVQRYGEREIQSKEIGYTVMMRLRELDDVAYVRFASVYRSFRDVSEFVQTLESDHGV